MAAAPLSIDEEGTLVKPGVPTRCFFLFRTLPFADESRDETPSREVSETMEGAKLLKTGERGAFEEPSLEPTVAG